MEKVVPGRYTAQTEDSFVVFMIGMRINRLWAVHRWLPVFMAMPGMIRELYMNRDLGFKEGHMHFSWRRVCLVQYWDSFEQLEHYARKGQKHLKAWRDFNRKIGTDGTVGIFHETYIIPRGNYESVYNNMPVFGLAKATSHVPATGRRETASRRLGRDSEPAVPTPANPVQ
ncbi:DUF4188 domain-containing protein [Paenibacillus dokdonensis]|uniref:DUF4188 domain-containing protein n=1 Tax=Paenibacillus dokdonensis TaxID=2567944 RepID=A0ABU6GI02_9BACL|nr:DUF4188 domain-containing protein [Paenibacillus dokdonensis]MEC0239361.1 DUF4188 domain-containing protein [Paenibacillus dokdonensis]